VQTDEELKNLDNESITSIHEWGNKTFGPNRTAFRIAIRAHRELSEVLTLIQKPNASEKILNELADVGIVMCGYLPLIFPFDIVMTYQKRLNSLVGVREFGDPIDRILECNHNLGALMGVLYLAEKRAKRINEKGLLTATDAAAEAIKKNTMMVAHNALVALHMAAINYIGPHPVQQAVIARTFWSEIEYKMKINRLRTWEVDYETGDASHVDPVRGEPWRNLPDQNDPIDDSGWDRGSDGS